MEKIVLDYPKSDVIIIPIFDISGSMRGEKLDAINEVMRKVPPQIEDLILNDYLGCNILVAPMKFSVGAEWFGLQDGKPISGEKCVWKDLKAETLSNFGQALRLLGEKLVDASKGGWMRELGGVAPIIMLFSDGNFDDEYHYQLNQIKQLPWFKLAIKWAIQLSWDCNWDALEEFTGNRDAIVDVGHVKNDLSRFIKVIVRSFSNPDEDRYIDDDFGELYKPAPVIEEKQEVKTVKVVSADGFTE